jgi:hypothetical protein
MTPVRRECANGRLILLAIVLVLLGICWRAARGGEARNSSPQRTQRTQR